MNRTRKRAVMRSLLLGMLGVGAIGVVQTSISSTAGAESVDVCTISARMSNQHGVSRRAIPTEPTSRIAFSIRRSGRRHRRCSSRRRSKPPRRVIGVGRVAYG